MRLAHVLDVGLIVEHSIVHYTEHPAVPWYVGEVYVDHGVERVVIEARNERHAENQSSACTAIPTTMLRAWLDWRITVKCSECGRPTGDWDAPWCAWCQEDLEWESERR